LKLIPNFQEFRSKLGQIYKEFNKSGPQMIDKNFFVKITESENTTSSFLNVKSENNKKAVNKRLIYNPNKEEEIKCKGIFDLFRKQMEDISSKFVSKEPIFYENENKVILKQI